MKIFHFALRSVWKMVTGKFPPDWQSIGHCIKILLILFFREKNRLQKQINSKKSIPLICILSTTLQCNLSCRGCYASNYAVADQLTLSEIDKIINEVLDLGSILIVITGGEPLMIPGLMPLLGSHRRGIFLLFSNGTLINEYTVQQIKKAGNILPVISIEGYEAEMIFRRGHDLYFSVLSSMGLLRRHHLPFGISTMITHHNIRIVLDLGWLKSMSKHGAVFGFMMNYISLPFSIDEKLILNEDDILYKNGQSDILRKKNPLTIFNFPEGECSRNGCLFTRNKQFHINMNGYAEPCPFCQVFVDNIRDKSIGEIVNSDFFRELRQEFKSLSVKNGSCTLFENMDTVQGVKARFVKQEIDFTKMPS